EGNAEPSRGVSVDGQRRPREWEVIRRAGSDGVVVHLRDGVADFCAVLRTVPGRPRRGPDRAQDAARPAAKRQGGDRVARGAGAGQTARPHAAVEPAPVNGPGKIPAIAILTGLTCAVAPLAEAQAPIRIGATVAETGAYAAIGQNQRRAYQLCVRQANDKGGVLGRKLELLVHDDASDPAMAVRLYEQLITRDKVDLVLGPHPSQITDPVADVTEKHRMPMVAPSAGAASIYRKGRKFVFSMLAPAEGNSEGLMDLAAKKGLKTVALI